MRFNLMKWKIVCTSLILLTPALAAAKSVRFVVTPPPSTSDAQPIHVAGNFNNWSLSGEQAVALTRQNGELVAQVETSEHELFFTVVKNQDWQHLPATLTGKSICTFYEKLGNQQGEKAADIRLTIPAWKTDSPTQTPKQSLTGNIQTLSNFDMPQLDRSADIKVYLPASYKADSDKRYPVLYMLDGQNVFDSATAYSDEWRVDEILSALEQDKNGIELIVVAVPNGPERWQEYNPWDFVNPQGQAQSGKGAATINFIKNTLKPYIDKHFQTHSQNTGLAGSSLGGLMALYGAIAHSDTFNFIAAFSPSMGVVNSQGEKVLFKAIQDSPASASKIYFDIGRIEYGDYALIEQLHALLKTQNNTSHLRMVKDNQGRHCELDWSKRFPDAIRWLLSEKS